MRFLRGLVGQPEVSEPTAMSPDGVAPGPITIETFGDDGWQRVQIDAGGSRVSETLNADGDVVGSTADGTQSMIVNDALVVIPPPQAADPAKRRHRPRQPIRMAIGPYEIEGFVSVPPGAVGSGFILRHRPRFVAVSSAVLRRDHDVGGERREDIVLVNLRHVSSLKDPPQS